MLKPSFLITGISLLGSGLGFLVQVLIASEFGAGVAVDAYLFATGFPIFLAGLVSTTFAYGLVPKIAGFESGRGERCRFIGAILLATLGLALLLAVAGMTIVRTQLLVLPTNSLIRTATDLNAMMYVGWILCGIQVILGCLVAILNGTGRFFTAAFIGLAPYLGMVVTLAVSSNDSALALPIGMALGSIVACVLGTVRIRGDIEFVHFAQMPWFRVSSFISSAPYNILATSCFSVYVVIDSYWAPQAGSGVFSNLGYAQRILIAVGNLAIIGPYTLIAPRLATLFAEKDIEAFRRVILHTLVVVCAGGVTLAASIGLTAEPLIKLLFYRGAFDNDNVQVLSSTVRLMAPGMVGMLVTAVLLKALFVLPGSELSTAVVGLSWSVLYFALSGLWVEHGSTGIATAYSVAWCLLAVMCTGVLVFRIKRC